MVGDWMPREVTLQAAKTKASPVEVVWSERAHGLTALALAGRVGAWKPWPLAGSSVGFCGCVSDYHGECEMSRTDVVVEHDLAIAGIPSDRHVLLALSLVTRLSVKSSGRASKESSEEHGRVIDHDLLCVLQ